MDLFEIIKSDHQKVLAMMETMIDAPSGQDERARLLADFKDVVLPHMQAEEEFFYPVVEEEAGGADRVFEAVAEHKAARNVLSDVFADQTDEEWTRRLSVLDELLRHHIREEEEEIFAIARQVVDDERARRMGERFEMLKEEAGTGRAY